MRVPFAYSSSWWQCVRTYGLVLLCICPFAHADLGCSLLLKDYSKAACEAQELLSGAYSLAEARLALQALSHSRLEVWFAAYKSCYQCYSELRQDRDIVETLALRVLEEGIKHPSVVVRAITLLSVGLARDYRLEEILLQSFSDDSLVVRTLAVQVALTYGSARLKQAIRQTAEHDRAMPVRLAAYRVGGALGIKSLAPLLELRAHDPLVDGQERREAWSVLLMLASPQQLSGDIDQALLACEAMAQGTLVPTQSLLLRLLSIEYPQVQEKALLASMSFEGDEAFYSYVRHLALHAPVAKVRFQAAALLALRSGDTSVLEEGLASPFATVSEAASEALCSLGIHGVPLAIRYLSTSTQKASVNLAILLLVCREQVEEAGEIIAQFVMHPEPCWAVTHFLGEPLLMELPQYPHWIQREMGKKLIRLLALAGYSQVKQVISDFLAEQQQGWSFFSEIFWEEGHEDTWNSSSMSGKLEAVLTSLAQRGDDQALYEAIDLYPVSRWQDKLALLEGIAFSENIKAVEFLLSCCQNEPPSLRSAAAGALFALFK